MSIMEIRNIRYSYDDKRNVLKSVNAELEAGKMYAILGSSGCGKNLYSQLWVDKKNFNVGGKQYCYFV